ncbi:hypothetical protein [uncultured Methylophaga sp.]|uniref:hypothetical protein n=1 Tax=uncultured Methylophaga sp. TaxID=285271 RepID=UPI00262D6B60|nr:hypothetical protein [uncultured Methylophaga sp.]
MQHLLSGLVMWAASISPYPEPTSMPGLKAITHRQLEVILCAGKPCNAVAYYDHHASIIYYDEAMDIENDIQAKGFIVHELVHYLQDEAGTMKDAPLPCDVYVALEQEAYQVQQQYLMQHQTLTYEVEAAVRLLDGLCEN